MALSEATPEVRLGFALREERASDSPWLTPVDVSRALYDFHLVYEVAVLTSIPDFRDYRFDRFFLMGRDRPVPRSYHLQLRSIGYQSPLAVLGWVPQAVAAVGGVLSLGKLIEYVFSIDVRVRAVRTEQKVRWKQALVDERALDEQLNRPEVEKTVTGLKRRVERNPLALEQAQLTEQGPQSYRIER